MEYSYPAVFHKNEDSTYTITFPDLPGCISEGKTIANAIFMSQAALTQWVEYSKDKKMQLPEPSPLASITVEKDEFVNFVCINYKENRAVKRTVSIPKWMDDLVIESGLSLSRILQDALKQRFKELNA